MSTAPLVISPTRRTRRKWQVLGLFALMSIVLALGAVEILARLVFRALDNDRSYYDLIDRRILPSYPTLDPKSDPKYGKPLPSNRVHTARSPEFEFEVRTNSLGFRTREIEPRRPNEWRVMMVGDSFFEGCSKVEDNIASQLERKGLAIPAPGRRLTVYNFAISGFTTVQELVVLRTFAPLVKPDQIIVGYLAANDTVPNAVQYIDDQGNLCVSRADVERVQSEVRERLGWLRHSRIFRALSVSLYTTRLYYQIANSPPILQKNYSLFDQVKEYCDRNGIELALVMMLCKDGVRGGLHGAITQSRPLNRVLVDYCRGRGIETLDMVDFIRGPQAVRDLFYSNEGHPNARGNHQIAEFIFDQAIAPRLKSPGPKSGGKAVHPKHGT